MKKFLSLFFVAVCGSGAFADEIGVQGGFPSAGVHYALSDVFGPTNNLRFSIGVPVFGAPGLFLDVDAMFGRAGLAKDLSLYYGISAQFGTDFDASFAVGAYGLSGLEYSFSPVVSAYLDAKIGYLFVSGGTISLGGPMVGAYLGVNFKF